MSTNRTRLPKRASPGQGFSLVELAVVMFIIALLIGGMVMPLSAQQDVRARQDSEKLLVEVREALYGFAAIHGRLPRPATSATDGSERPVCANDADCSGFIPWAALGLNRADGWNKLIRYSVTPKYSEDSISNIANLCSSTAPVNCPNRTVQSRQTDGALFFLVGGNACTTASACAPAVLFTQGKSNWGTTEAGQAIGNASSTNADETANNTGPLVYFSRLATDNKDAVGGEFDDQVLWVSSSALFSRLVAAGKL